MNTKNLYQTYKKLIIATAITVAYPVHAQNSPSALEEVIVTAERRAADVQDIPISMTALTGDQMEKKSVQRLDDLQFAAPGLTITDAGLTQSVNIRGIGLASGDPDVTNGVGTYMDGLFQPPIVSTNSFYDIQSVQVLRGPQGTFAGANSTGGAIQIASQKPELGEAINGYAKVGIGNYSRQELEGAVGASLGDSFAYRAAFFDAQRDSFYDNIGPANSDAGSLDETAGRLSLLWAPTESLELLAKYEKAEKDSGGFAYRPIPTTAFAAGRSNNIRDLTYNTPTANDEEAETGLFQASYTFANNLAIKWLTGYQEKSVSNIYDSDGTLLAEDTREQFVGEDQVSHELNIISPDDADIRWVVGGYYQRNVVDVDIVNGPFPVEIYIDNEKTISGIFGQISVDVNEQLTVEYGMRQAWFEASVDDGSGVFVGNGLPGFPAGGAQVAVIAGDYEDDDLVGKLAVNYSLNNDHLLYAFVAKGYKPGGINSATSSFESENVWSYEAGWKGTMMDGAVRASAAVFYNDYQDFQNSAIDLTTGRSDVYNIADATIQGVEMSLEAQLAGIHIDMGLAYVDSELNPTQPLVNSRALPGNNLGPQCAAGTASNPPVCFDYAPYLLSSSGGPNLYAPELSFNMGVEYTVALNNGWTITPRLNYAWLDEQWTNLIYDEQTDLLESRGLLSAMLTVENDDWKIHAYGRNLTDEDYVTGQEGTFNQEFYGAPTEYGLGATFNF
ncbi:TonB-dependent receptor [Halioxenophilus aromaticivorans]|uniref:TonB-dependent receptor n=1 Tax=Halioxenophilus aromaticivorans TaxID=1306992 RepID=A0AAV3UAE4_9ALTE